MSPKLNNALKETAVFIMGRYPVVHSLLLFMILGERAPQDKNIPPYDQLWIYGYLVLSTLVAIGMSYDAGRKHCALTFSALIMLLCLAIYSNQKLGYSPWLKNRLLNRCIGLMGVYIIYAFLMSKEKNKQLQKVGEGVLAVFTMTYMYILVNSAEDRALFNSKIPVSDGSLFFLVTVMGGCAMIYISGGIFLTDASQAMLCINLALLLTIDSDFYYWTKKRGVPFWVQVKLCVDDVVLSVGLYLMAMAKIYWKGRMPKKDEFGRPFPK